MSRKKVTNIPDNLQYLYYAICELVDIPTANGLLDSGELAEWVEKQPNPLEEKK